MTDRSGPKILDNFTFVRLLAAFLVLYSHQCALTGRPEPIFIGIHSFGGLGVLIFFSISGFLVTKSWLTDPNVARFVARRMLRIWPAFAMIILLAALILGPTLTSLSLSEYFRHPQLKEYAVNNIFFNLRETLPGLKFDGSAVPYAINGSLWTIPLELKCYGLLALLGFTGAFRRLFIVPTLALAFVLFHAVFQVRGEWLIAGNLITTEGLYFIEFFIFFLIGASLQLVWPGDRRALRLPLALVIVGGTTAMFFGRPMLAAMIWVPFLSLWVGTASLFPFNRFEYFGDPSYSLYLFAFPVQQLAIHFLHKSLDWWALLVVAVMLTMACAYLSWHGVEKWAMRYKPRTDPRGTLAGR